MSSKNKNKQERIKLVRLGNLQKLTPASQHVFGSPMDSLRHGLCLLRVLQVWSSNVF